MEKSNLLVAQLILEGVITPTEENIFKARAVIRIHLNNTFRDGVIEEKMARNKKVYVEPIFQD